MSRKKSLPRSVHWLMAFAMLPFLWAVLRQTSFIVIDIVTEGLRTWWLYGAGILTYVVFERLVSKPMWLYVFGHEMTHVLSGFMSGAKVHSFKAKSSGGEVRLSKSNAFIALSPYIFPLYALGVIAIYVVTRHWWNPPQLFPVFQFLLGLAIAFHISLTVSAVHRHQPDLRVLGMLLSGVLIVLGNLLIVAALGISLFSHTLTFKEFSKKVGSDTASAWKTTYHGAIFAGGKIYHVLKEHVWIR